MLRITPLLLLVLLSLILATSSCTTVTATKCVAPTDEANSDCRVTSVAINNPRIEISGEPSLHPSSSLWIRAGENLQARWDSYTYFMSFGGASCDFSQLSEKTDECAICNWCLAGPEFERLCPFDTLGLTPAEGLRLIPREGFMDPPLETVFLHNLGGCGARGNSPFSFTPSVNTGYDLLNPQFSPDEVLTSKKVFVVGNGLTQPALYPLLRYEEPHPDIVWYTWTMMGDAAWEDNFSKNVRITGVKILNGSSLIADPNSGRLMVADSRPVRASRVVLIPNFDPSLTVLSQDAYVCYSSSAGQLDLANCLAAYQATNGSLLDAVPTYMKAQPTDLLTWVVEFNPNESADPVPSSGQMAIEFTIEAVQ